MSQNWVCWLLSSASLRRCIICGCEKLTRLSRLPRIKHQMNWALEVPRIFCLTARWHDFGFFFLLLGCWGNLIVWYLMLVFPWAVLRSVISSLGFYLVLREELEGECYCVFKRRLVWNELYLYSFFTICCHYLLSIPSEWCPSMFALLLLFLSYCYDFHTKLAILRMTTIKRVIKLDDFQIHLVFIVRFDRTWVFGQ